MSKIADELKAPKLLPALCRAAALTQLHHRSCFRPPTADDTQERQRLPMTESAKIAARALPSFHARSTAPPQLIPTADTAYDT